MDWTNILTTFIGSGGAIAATGASIDVWRRAMSGGQIRTERMRDRYKFIKEYLQDIQNLKASMSELQRGIAHRTIIGVDWITVAEGDYLLNLEDAALQIDRYVRGHAFLEFIDKNNVSEMQYKRKYRSSSNRKFYKNFFSFFYFAAAFLALLAPILGFGHLGLTGEWAVISLFFVSLFVFAANLSLNALIRYDAAERFMASLKPLQIQDFPALDRN